MKCSWLYGVALIGSCCSLRVYPSSSEARVYFVRQNSAPRHASAADVGSEDIEQLHTLLRQAGIYPKDCTIKALSGPGFCNALYKVQCGEKKVRASG